jgi:Tol biopolymer transport system component
MNSLRISSVLPILFCLAGLAAAQPTTRVSTDSSGAQAKNWSAVAALSFDGRFVAFESLATNLVPHDVNQEDIFVKDRLTGVTTRVSLSSSGADAKGDCFAPSISADGRWVAFVSKGDKLVPGDTNGVEDVFLRDRDADGNGVFDEPGGVTTTRVSVDSLGTQANGFSARPSVSADGRFVTFESYATNLVPGDSNGAIDVFVYEVATGIVKRVSVDSLDSEANAQSGAAVVFCRRSLRRVRE